MKPLVSYYGGKQRMIKNLLPLIPEHKIYVEPFCGGASLFFSKPKEKVSNIGHYIEVLNDTNKDLIHLYYVAQSHPKEFLEYLERFPYSEYWHNYFKKNKNIKHPIKRAVGIYIRIMSSFSKIMDSGFAFGKKSKHHAQSYLNRIERLPEIIDRLKGIYIFCRDAINIIDRFDSEDTFFYCDPPYPNTAQGHYKGYTQKDFENLIEILSQSKGSFLLSGYENDAVPKDWERFEFNVVNTSSNTSKGGHRERRTEVVWRKVNQKKESHQYELFKKVLIA